MAITTLSGVISGLRPPIAYAKGNFTTGDGSVGALLTYWQYGSIPAAGSYSTTLNGAVLSGGPNYSNNIVGQLPYEDPASGDGYLAKLTCAIMRDANSTSNPALGTLYLCDRLWHNGGINGNSTAAQTIVSPTWPSRDDNGSSNGDGVMLALELSSGTNTPPGAFTVSYTNSAGVSGRTGTALMSHANDERNQVYEVALAAGDTGVRSVQSLTLGTANTPCTWNLVAYRPIACLPITQFNKTFVLDAIQAGFPKIFNGSVLYFMCRCGNPITGSNPTPFFTGTVTFAQG